MMVVGWEGEGGSHGASDSLGWLISFDRTSLVGMQVSTSISSPALLSPPDVEQSMQERSESAETRGGWGCLPQPGWQLQPYHGRFSADSGPRPAACQTCHAPAAVNIR